MGYRFVKPRLVVEVSVLDVIGQTTRGAPITTMCLDFVPAPSIPGIGTVDHWRIIRRMPGVSLISPQFVRVRDDKGVYAQDLRLAQISSIVEIAQADADACQFTLPKSEILRREVYLKQQKGQTMVRKLLLWATHKADSAIAGGQDYPSFVVACTGYSPNRQTPLERDIRVSNSREHIEEMWQALGKEKIVKGWVPA